MQLLDPHLNVAYLQLKTVPVRTADRVGGVMAIHSRPVAIDLGVPTVPKLDAKAPRGTESDTSSTKPCC